MPPRRLEMKKWIDVSERFRRRTSNRSEGILCVFRRTVVQYCAERSAVSIHFYMRAVAIIKREQGETNDRPAITPVLL